MLGRTLHHNPSLVGEMNDRKDRYRNNAHFLLLKQFPDMGREIDYHEIRAGIDLHYPGGWHAFCHDLDGESLREFLEDGR